MKEYDQFYDWIMDYATKFFFPEQWIPLDLSLSKTEMYCLILINQRDEVTMSELADILHVPLSTATGVIDRLVKKKFLKRERREEDRRIVIIKLSDQGLEFTQELKKTLFKYFQNVNEVLTDEEKQFLIRLTPKIMGLLQNMNLNATSERESNEQSKIKKIEIE